MVLNRPPLETIPVSHDDTKKSTVLLTPKDRPVAASWGGDGEQDRGFPP